MTNQTCKIEVGMGATELCYTDRHAYTVIAISDSGKTITVQADTEIRVDGNGDSECQEYRFEPNPEGQIYKLRLTKYRGWAHKNTRFAIGYRRAYYDYGF